MGFPGSSAGKESAFSAGDSGLIPESGISPREGISSPLQYSWASVVAQMVKNPPELQKTWVQSPGWEDPLEEGWQPTPVFLPGESPWTDEPGGLRSLRSQRVDVTEWLSIAQHMKESMDGRWSNVPTEDNIFSE